MHSVFYFGLIIAQLHAYLMLCMMLLKGIILSVRQEKIWITENFALIFCK